MNPLKLELSSNKNGDDEKDAGDFWILPSNRIQRFGTQEYTKTLVEKMKARIESARKLRLDAGESVSRGAGDLRQGLGHLVEDMSW